MPKNCVTLHISGTIHHVCVIYGTLVYNDDMSKNFLSIFSNFCFQVVRGVKGQKMVQNEKKILFVALYISETIHTMIFIYGTHA